MPAKKQELKEEVDEAVDEAADEAKEGNVATADDPNDTLHVRDRRPE